MVTRIHKHVPKRLLLRAHRKAKGISAKAMGGRLGIERESVYRQEREPWRLTSDDQAKWAFALDVEPWELWHPPGRQSLDALVADSPEDIRAMAVDIVRRLVAKR